MASRYFAKLLSCFSLRYFPRGAVQQNVTPKLFSLCRLNEKKTTVFHKVANFSPVWKKSLPSIIDRSTKRDEGRDGIRSSGSWRSWSSTGTVLMVGGLVLSSEHRNDQGETGAERGELRDGQGQFSSKAKLEKKRSGHQRTQEIREWRAKRKLEFEESDPTAKLIPVETRASKVRVHFDALLLGVFLAQFQVNHIPVFLCCCSFKPFLLLPYPATLFTFIEHINMIAFFYFPALQLYIHRTNYSSNFKITLIY